MQTKGHNGDGSLRDSVERGTSILLLSPSLDEATDDACLDLLTLDRPRAENVLWVTYTRSPDSCVQDWLSHAGEQPNNMRFVSVGETTRSAAAAPSDGRDVGGELVETLSSPGDLTGLGIKLSEILKEWSAADADTVACFHSLTALLQYADLQTVYKFLHVLTGRFEAAGVTGHFHLDPDACDAQTVSTLTSLFDTVVERDDGEWVVRSR
ncbi:MULTISPECIES: DUF7504 family protein [Halorussus]|uniref:DUF7504 family protein n=1 Tax=Halorussus TaxID=1070314 RepID=UPI00209D79CC|nr:hypothetical protein [Halorussus vallis]USZ74367.1 hypothetical protein NGM07_13040 [Halorussus vallis]